VNISELLARNTRKFPATEAIIEGETAFSYAELDDSVNRLASSLARLGIQTGDKVILYMPNTKEFVISYFTVLRLGAIVVPINARLTAEEVKYIIHHSEAKALIAHDWVYKALQSLVADNDILWIKTGDEQDRWLSFAKLVEKGTSKSIVCTLDEDEKATILDTSGTTGRPKGVLFTYRNILTVAVMMALETKMDRKSRILHMMPLSHSAPLHLFFIAGTYVGATHVLSPTFSPETLLELTDKHQITHFFGAPVAYLLTAKHPHIHHYDLTSVKYWVYG
jgi:acyl-CoA synthetase (AMP-forming)/AMP-acid ligase II